MLQFTRAGEGVRAEFAQAVAHAQSRFDGILAHEQQTGRHFQGLAQAPIVNRFTGVAPADPTLAHGYALGPIADAPGWRVEEIHGWVTVAHGEHESTRFVPQRRFVFDVAEFTRWYIAQRDLKGQAFAELHGGIEAVKVPQIVLRTKEDDPRPDSRMELRTADGLMLVSDHGVYSFQASRSHFKPTPLIPLDLNNPPELHYPEAVFYDLAKGFCTPLQNIVVRQKEDFLDKLLPLFQLATLAIMSIGTGLAAGWTNMLGASLSIQGAIGMGAVGSLYSGLIHGNLHLKDILRGAFTSTITFGAGQHFNALGVQGGQVVNYVERGAGIASMATLQGVLSEVTGGEFKDAFTQSLATGLGGEAMRSLDAQIELKAQGQHITEVEQSQLRIMSRAAGSAIRLLASPDDPLHGFAQEMVGAMVQGGMSVGFKARQAADLQTLDDAAFQRQVEANARRGDRQNLQAMQAQLRKEAQSAHDVTGGNQLSFVQQQQAQLQARIEQVDAALQGLARSIPSAPLLPGPDTVRAIEHDYRIATDTSIAGRGHVAQAGDSLSRIVGSSDPQAIGNFMRANNLTSDRIEVGRNYFVPDSHTAYGEAAALGQLALNQSNSRVVANAPIELNGAGQSFAELSKPGASTGTNGATVDPSTASMNPAHPGAGVVSAGAALALNGTRVLTAPELSVELATLRTLGTGIALLTAPSNSMQSEGEVKQLNDHQRLLRRPGDQKWELQERGEYVWAMRDNTWDTRCFDISCTKWATVGWR